MFNFYLIDLLFFVFLLLLCVSPLFMVLIFVFYLLGFGLSLSFLLNSYYYSYVVYLLFLSGLLIMMMYICSIVDNEKIVLSFNIFFFILLFWGGVAFFYGAVDNFVVLNEFLYVYHEFYNLVKFFLFSFNLFSLFFVVYLFLCLVVISEVIKKNKGPLRMGGG